MKAQKPANGILVNRDYGSSMSYTVTCECGDHNHIHNIWVESDDFGVTVHTYSEQKTNWWSKTRWHHIWKLLTTGYIRYDSCIMMNEQQAVNYAEVLKQAVKDVKNFKNDTIKAAGNK